jgi:hypothetical protein
MDVVRLVALVALFVLFVACHALLPLSQKEAGDGQSPDHRAEDGHPALDSPVDLPSGTDGADDISRPDGLADLSRDYPPCGSCDDGIACTDDSCQYGACVHTPKAGFCVIAGACVAEKTENPQNPLCELCNPSKSTSAWSPDDGIRCDDKVTCSYGDKCSAGACKGTSYTCTADAAALACIQDTCTGGGPPPWGCVIDAGACLIEDACHAEGAASAGNPCMLCAPAVSAYSWAPAKGCVTTLAGDGTNNPTAHFGVKAQFSQPRGVAVGDDAVWVVEHDGCVVRRVAAGAAEIAAGCG